MPADPSKRVLVVDDDPQIRRMLSTLFTNNGLWVDAAADGDEALAMIAANQYAVIVLDLIMPVVDGFSVLGALRSAAAPANSTVVIVLTGAEPETYAALDPSVIHGIVRKPFDSIELGNLVRSCVEVRNRSMFETMAIAAAVAGAPFVALLSRM